VRLEGAASDSSASAYGRAAADFTLSQGFGRGSLSLTLSGGSSAGELPPQRRWYIGGAHTVRGQRADTAVNGDAYWLTRLELGGRLQAARPVIFGDLGWVGSRTAWREVARPMSGAGFGLSILDGLVRFDLSRGIHPVRRLRFDAYVEARF
jgi:hemolysin activation/secretion protein